jgi:putative ABC transport system permease protein
MVRHLFKMIWNKKKQNFLLIMELFISFLVLFGVFTLLVYNTRNYLKPMGFDYANVWAITFSLESAEKDSTGDYRDRVRDLLRSMPEVSAQSFCSNNLPFSMSSYNNGVTYGKKKMSSNIYVTEDDYNKVLKVNITEGRWYGKQDDGLKYHSIVINETLKKDLFGNEPAVGKLINTEVESESKKVVGVVQDFKDKGDFQAAERCFYEKVDTGRNGMEALRCVLVRFKSPQGAAVEAKLHKALSNVVKGANIEIEYLTAKRTEKNNFTLVPMIILIIVCSFLVFNVSLGLFGVIWYNISKRRAEIGLRRAVGATAPNISWQFIAEAMVVTTFALLVGCFFAVQFPLMNVFDVSSGTYLLAILLTVLFIYSLVLFCAFYPGKQAAKIYPAVALHED